MSPPTARRILIVEDEPDSARSLALIVGVMGHRAEYINDPTIALETARRMRPDLVFLDIGLPKIDGYTLAKMFRREFGFDAMRLVALTGHGLPTDRAHSREAGFDAHVLKPADPDVIESILKTLPK
ncbi:MAG: hypothetical protein A3G81_25935 [Betaproteobacteria bacterium RIFCSPLOWO2_12_FULL_65_14]|nr:MAG: hypothetical protein A3G81_25935 [Betaproteobacteria bacterium RIFCSPLOWO2_12_FULL_65_14]